MKTPDIHRYRMLVRVREFGAAHRHQFPAAGPAAQLLAAVSKAVDELSTYVDDQAAGQDASREGATSKAAARDALTQALDAITRTARALTTLGLGSKIQDRKSTRLNSSHRSISYAVFCLKKKNAASPRQCADAMSRPNRFGFARE